MHGNRNIFSQRFFNDEKIATLAYVIIISAIAGILLKPQVKKSRGFDIVINILFSWVIAVAQIDWRVGFCYVGNSYLVFIDRSDQSGSLLLWSEKYFIWKIPLIRF